MHVCTLTLYFKIILYYYFMILSLFCIYFYADKNPTHICGNGHWVTTFCAFIVVLRRTSSPKLSRCRICRRILERFNWSTKTRFFEAQMKVQQTGGGGSDNT